MKEAQFRRVLFVCTGNICRSPTAEGIALYWAKKLGLDGVASFDSAGTHAYHVGEAPDPRTQEAALSRGYDLSRLRARRVEQGDFSRFDLILAMDRGHLRELQRECPAEHQQKLALFTTFSATFGGRDVPDPYYGDADGFERVLDMCEDGVHGLLDRLR